MKMLVVSTLAAIAVATAPVAVADDFYLEQVRDNVATPLASADAMQLGHVACDAILAGVADGLSIAQARNRADQAVGLAQQNMGLGLTMADGMFLVEAAEDQLC